MAFKIWTAVSRVEKYKIGAAVQILETIRFILFGDDSFMKGQSNIWRFIYERSATNIRDWWLAYSFKCWYRPWQLLSCWTQLWSRPVNSKVANCLSTKSYFRRLGRSFDANLNSHVDPIVKHYLYYSVSRRKSVGTLLLFSLCHVVWNITFEVKAGLVC